MLSLLATSTPTTVTASTIMDILSAITDVFSVANIVAMIAGILGVSVTFTFLWWGVRKGARTVYEAVKYGRFKV